MVHGPKGGVFASSEENVMGAPLPDQFNPITFPSNFIANMVSGPKVKITEFKIRAKKVCTTGGVLGLTVTYFSRSKKQEQVSENLLLI